ncbi:MAG TPA: oligosaccharide flippase family protein [Kofleriaceae bacterium]|nr:oligosaccharide flippase family protein [Kofleriaceae bacterium]
MSVGKRAARGAIWSVGVSTGTRMLGLIGTLFMTRFLNPDEVGEVYTALAIGQTANWLSNWGFNQYMVVHGRDSAERTYHVAVMNYVLGLVALGVAAGTGIVFAPVFHAPHLAAYMPGLTLSILIRRAGAVPDKVLTRELRFRELSIADGAGSVAYTITAIGLAAADFGGQSMVIGNIVQATLTSALIFRATGLGWLQRAPWRWSRVREIVRFGVPVGLAQVFDFASRYWDNLLFAKFFGQEQVGLYNMAYNLADIPAVQVGEQIGNVLLPAMTSLEIKDRKSALLRATALMSLVVFPLAVGLGSVADTLIAALFNVHWRGVAPLLVVLSMLSVVRPMAWGVSAYLQAFSRVRTLMLLQLLKLVLLFGCMAAFSSLGPRWTAGAVGVAFGVQSLVAIGLVIITDRVPAAPIVGAVVRPLVACAAMAAAVYGARHGLLAAGVHWPIVRLPIEILAGAAVYVLVALVVARAAARDLLQMARRALKRGD